jgi:hypothetical protein
VIGTAEEVAEKLSFSCCYSPQRASPWPICYFYSWILLTGVFLQTLRPWVLPRR